MASEASKTRIVVEAKIGAAEPSPEQILTYARDKDSWKKFDDRTIATLTHVELSSSVRNAVIPNLEPKRIRLKPIQWHQVIELVLRHRPSDGSAVSQYLLHEFMAHIREDYEMRYHDAEVLIQDTNPLNAKIFEEGWMQVSSDKTKHAPLYVAPYYTGQGTNSGISKASRVIDSQTAVLADYPDDIRVDGTDVQKEQWREGLRMLKERAQKEGFFNKKVRLFYLDRPIEFRQTPLTKKAFRATGPEKQIPNQIPQGFSLRFDELLRA